MATLEEKRQRMVKDQLRSRGVRDAKVLAAMANVHREAFVPLDMREFAYEDRPLPIAAGQTISQPYIVAFMIEALNLKAGDKVLEIGAGSGYAAAVLAEIAGTVYSIERIGELARNAAESLKNQGYDNVHVLHADGTRGWAEHAPYDAILVSAGAPVVPEDLKRQLAVGGRMVVPVGDTQYMQELLRISHRGNGVFDRENLADVRFVPLIGEHGWEEESNGAESSRPREHDNPGT